MRTTAKLNIKGFKNGIKKVQIPHGSRTQSIVYQQLKKDKNNG